MRVVALLHVALAVWLAACQPASPGAGPGAPQTGMSTRWAAPASDADALRARPEVQRLLAAARDQGETELTLSWSEGSVGGADGARQFEALFNRAYGTNVRFHWTPGPSMTDMAAKVTQEVAAGRRASTDILVGTETHFSALFDREVLEQYDYTLLSPRIRPEMLAPNEIGLEIHSGVSGVAYNTELVAPAEVPRRLRDLLNPKWRGRVAGTENAAGLDRWALTPDWNPEKMKAFAFELSEQVGGLIRCGEQARIATGEFLMVPGCSANNVQPLQVRGAPLGFTVLEDAATLHFQYLGVPRNAAHPNLSKLFIGIVMSEEGQRILYETQATDHYALPGSQSAAVLSELRAKRIEPLRIDVQFVLDHPELRELSRDLSRAFRERS
jgi:ABC-type Fe3+ transport system substrate-binding protein